MPPHKCCNRFVGIVHQPTETYQEKRICLFAPDGKRGNRCLLYAEICDVTSCGTLLLRDHLLLPQNRVHPTKWPLKRSLPWERYQQLSLVISGAFIVVSSAAQWRAPRPHVGWCPGLKRPWLSVGCGQRREPSVCGRRQPHQVPHHPRFDAATPGSQHGEAAAKGLRAFSTLPCSRA